MHLSLSIEQDGQTTVLADKINATDFYWSMPQLLVHQTVSGCPVKTGDLVATGTCSGTTIDTLGSIIEITQGGQKPWKSVSGTEHTFLEDGQTVIMRGYCQKGDARVGFGECSGKVLPADVL